MKTVKIFGYDYKIVPNDGMGFSGRLMSGSQDLLIDTSQCKQHQLSTIFHEVIEAVNYHLELNMKHNLIMQLETGLYSFLSDNPEYLRELIKSGGKKCNSSPSKTSQE